MSLASWKSHFDEICRLLESAERQYGVANTNYADVTIERLELAIQSVLTIRNGMNSFSVAGDTDMSSTINDYKGDLVKQGPWDIVPSEGTAGHSPM